MSRSSAALAQPQLTDVTLTRDDMGFISKLVYEHAGIVIREHKEAMTRGRLARRVKALGLNSVAEYCAYLKTPQAADEIPELINAVTTNHTSFFRERHHFDHLRKDVLPRLVQERAGRRGRIRRRLQDPGDRHRHRHPRQGRGGHLFAGSVRPPAV